MIRPEDKQQVTASAASYQETHKMPGMSFPLSSLLTILAHAYIIQMSFINCSATEVRHIDPESALSNPIVADADRLYRPILEATQGPLTRRKRSAAIMNQVSNSQKYVDACQSKMEVLTPYYATNSKGKLRTIVNSELMQQAIQVETCVR